MENLYSKDLEFIWKIENFSMCHQTMDSFLESPEFGYLVAPIVSGVEHTDTRPRSDLSSLSIFRSRFKLRLYPRGTTDEKKRVVCSFEPQKSFITMEETAEIRLSYLKTDGSAHLAEEMSLSKEGERSSQRQNFKTRERIFREDGKYLKNDVFTIQCQVCLRQGIPVKWQSRSEEKFPTVVARTKIHAVRNIFDVKVPRMSNIPKQWLILSPRFDRGSNNIEIQIGNSARTHNLYFESSCGIALFKINAFLKEESGELKIVYQDEYIPQKKWISYLLPNWISLPDFSIEVESGLDNSADELTFHLNLTISDGSETFSGIEEFISCKCKENYQGMS